jgi:hypothetical protein
VGRVIAVSLSSPYAGTVVTLSADQSTTNTAYTGLTGMNSIAIPAGQITEFEFIGAYTAAATTTGCLMSARVTSGTGTTRGSMYGHNAQSSASTALTLEDGVVYSVGSAVLTTLDITGANSVAGNNFVHFKGVIDARSATTAGLLTIAWATEVSLSAVVIKAGSTLKYESYT